MKNALWIHSRCKAAYHEFHDVVSFDTTYLVNRYDMPFASFVRVNYHGQSILLGCALVLNKDILLFKWIFSNWNEAMSGMRPTAILIDQCESIKGSIREAMPEIVHRYCLWHILSKVPEKFKAAAEFEEAKFHFKALVYDCFTITAFETKSEEFKHRHGLEDNRWLEKLYTERESWAPVYLRHIFTAGMVSTQRSESMHAFFDGYLQSKSTLKQFFKQYEVALNAKMEKELFADFQCKDRSIKCLSQFKWEQQFQEAYTHNMFKAVQEEILCVMYYHVIPHDPESGEFAVVIGEGRHRVETYKVLEKFLLKNLYYKKFVFMVEFRPTRKYWSCQCKKFKSTNLLCFHIFKIMSFKDISIINERYIVPRWRKDVQRKHTSITCLGCYPHMTKEYSQYKELEGSFEDCVDLCRGSEGKSDFVKQSLADLKK